MISLNNLTISSKAASGAIVGTLTLLDASRVGMSASFMLDQGAAGFFAVSGNSIVTEGAPIPIGSYSVRVRGVGTNTWWKDEGIFTITVTA